MPYAANPRVAGIGIDVEPAHGDETAGDRRGEESLAGTVEPVGLIRPVVDEAADDPRSGRLAVGEEVTDAVGGQVVKRLDRHKIGGDPARRPVNARRARSSPGAGDDKFE